MTDDSTPTPETAPASSGGDEARAERPAATAAELRDELRAWCDAWKSCLEKVLSQVSGTGPAAAFEISRRTLAAADSDVWYTIAADGAVRGEMSLRVPAASGNRLARKLLSEPEPPPATEGAAPESVSAENKEALEELLRQVAGLTATALGSICGGEVKLQISAASAPAAAAQTVVCFETSGDSGARILIEARIGPALATELQAHAAKTSAASALTSSQTPSQTAPQSTAQPTSQPPPPSSSAAAQAGAASYGRLMDVGLDVKLRFGTRRMLLRDVLALSPGVVVELDNTLHSPVDLLLDGRLIAQGEVVIVDGKYGLRVTEVADSPAAAGAAV